MLKWLKPKSESVLEPASTTWRSVFSKTKQKWLASVASLLFGEKTLSKELYEQLETVLLTADVGVQTTRTLLEEMTQQLKKNTLSDSDQVINTLKNILKNILKTNIAPWTLSKLSTPYVILFVGVNGTGKTTSLGKLAYYLKREHSVLLAAGDTFRAAAIEQLKLWGERNQVPVIAQHPGADSASVIYDAYQAAKARNIQVVLADTAGRLHTQAQLMEELKKISRVLKKCDPLAPQEVWLVCDANLGQNTVQQVQQFKEAMGVTGLVLTKLEGSAKGGVIFQIVDRFQLPIRFVGIGEKISDLMPFDVEAFVDSLF